MPYYLALIHQADDSDYGVMFPDFPGCLSGGPSLDAARAASGEALALHVDGLREDGVEIPAPSSLDEIREHPDYAEAAAVIEVALVEPAGRLVRINISTTEAALARIDRAARAAGQTRSAFMVQAATGVADSTLDRKSSR